MVTHELPSIFRIADRVVVLDAAVKTMVAAGELREIRGVALALSLAIRETPVPAKVFFGEVLQERRMA